MEGLGAGLAAFAFWGFLAAIVLGGIWYAVREREAQYETVRRIVESGQELDQLALDKILGNSGRLDRDLRMSGLIVLFVAPGLALLGWFLGDVSLAARSALFGVAGLTAFIAVGLLIAAKSVANSAPGTDIQPGPR